MITIKELGDLLDLVEKKGNHYGDYDREAIAARRKIVEGITSLKNAAEEANAAWAALEPLMERLVQAELNAKIARQSAESWEAAHWRVHYENSHRIESLEQELRHARETQDLTADTQVD